MQLTETHSVVKVKMLNPRNSCNLSYTINDYVTHYIICKILYGIEILIPSRTNLAEVMYYFRGYDFIVLAENSVIWI